MTVVSQNISEILEEQLHKALSEEIDKQIINALSTRGNFFDRKSKIDKFLNKKSNQNFCTIIPSSKVLD